MIRDITIGQYYPADSVIHKLDPGIYHFSVCVSVGGRLPCGNDFSGGSDPCFKGSVWIYDKGSEVDHHAADDHSNL